MKSLKKVPVLLGYQRNLLFFERILATRDKDASNGVGSIQFLAISKQCQGVLCSSATVPVWCACAMRVRENDITVHRSSAPPLPPRVALMFGVKSLG